MDPENKEVHVKEAEFDRCCFLNNNRLKSTFFELRVLGDDSKFLSAETGRCGVKPAIVKNITLPPVSQFMVLHRTDT
jgi:hypothetical protein